MKVLAMHDEQGNISAVVVEPDDDAGRAGLMPQGAQSLTEVAVDAVTADMTDEENVRRILEIAEQFRVEVKKEGRLVRKSEEGDSTGSSKQPGR